MARLLVKKNIAKAILRNSQSLDGSPPDDHLPDGHMKLYSFYTPSLEAGPYAVEVKQTVKATANPDLQIWNYLGQRQAPLPTPARQKFVVAAPQFNIDPKFINTYYPPSGHSDEGRILPHIVFNDAHVPWLRRAGVHYDFLKQPFNPAPITNSSIVPPATTSTGPPRSMVPWMAVVVFSLEELLISPEEAASVGLTQIKSGLDKAYDPTKLPANGAYSMTVGDMMTKIPDSRIKYELGGGEDLTGSTEMTSVIFPTKKLLQQLFGKKNDSSLLEGHRLMAHVRHINTLGFPDAGVEEEGYFSVVVSSRTGVVGSSVPITQIVHLISLEHYDSTVNGATEKFSSFSDSSRIGVVSLFSWTYTCIPEVVNFADTMKYLGDTKQALQPPESVLKSIKDSIDKQTSKAQQQGYTTLHDRLERSYTIARWRTPTGEETAAFNRGPLVANPTPVVPASGPVSWPSLSMTGRDLQIFDSSVGMMDVTYSSAFSLGRLVAISDSPFNAALLRFRSLVHNTAASETRMLINKLSTRKQILSGTSRALQDASTIKASVFDGQVQRVTPPSSAEMPPILTHPDVAPIMAEATNNVIDNLTSVQDGKDIYSDFHLDEARNSDWELIHNWISETLFLKHIPAHYLFPEPSHIRGAPEAAAQPLLPNSPPEALRFFHIDHSWLDAFVDGALSCANHLEPEWDSTRIRIKDTYNYYLSNHINGLEGVTPPIPRYGFVIRSLAVKATPDLKITVTCWKLDPATQTWMPDVNPKTRKDPVVQLTRMDDFTILCLLDCLPEQIHEIRFAQPPHQQRFAMGDSLKAENGATKPELPIRMLYTSDTTTGSEKDGTWPFLKTRPNDEDSYYDAETRFIRPTNIVNSIQNALLNNTEYPKLYNDTVTNSCILGIELNDPCYTLIIKGPAPVRKTDFDPWIRQLWTGPDPSTSRHAGIDTTRTDIIPQTTPPAETGVVVQSTTIPNTPPSIPLAPSQNATRVIPSPQATTNASKTLKLGRVILEPQFRLIVHVDYRPPPPTPKMLVNGPLYAPMDYLPTKSPFLYDLILAIRHKSPQSTSKFQLAQLDIELPISDGVDAADNRNRVREPLIPVGGYRGPGVRMANNLRFVPTLRSSVDKDNKPILVVSLVPRSSRKDATITVTNDGRTDEMSVRLAECPIEPIKNPSQRVTYAKVGGGTASVPTGMCKLVMKETYLVDVGQGRMERRTVQTDAEIDPSQQNPDLPLVALKQAVEL